jgi:hypothetical protein
MKSYTSLLVIAVTVAVTWMTPSAKANATYAASVEIRDVSDFYEPLAQHGNWIWLNRHGWCWYPSDVETNWQPYRDGQWVWCDQGWYWDSGEPWAWATYHYGRWAWDSYYGWLWIPDVLWAPSWVCWREGGGYVGWAPLPPRYDSGPQYNVVVVALQYFIFVEHRHFCEPIRPSVVVVNQTVINQTVNITRFGKGSQVVINPGPSLATIERSNPGRVVKVRPEHRLPAEVQLARQDWRETPATQRPVTPVIRGTRQIADVRTVASPMSSTAGNDQQPAVVRPTPKSDRRQGKWSPPQPPVTVVAPSKAQTLAPTVAPLSEPENNAGRKRDQHKVNADAGTLSSQGR